MHFSKRELPMAEKVTMEFVQEGKNATEYSFSAHVTNNTRTQTFIELSEESSESLMVATGTFHSLTLKQQSIFCQEEVNITDRCVLTEVTTLIPS